MNRLLTFTTLACLGSTLGACASHAARPEPEAPPATLALASAHMEPLTVVYRASGTVRGRNTAVLTSKTIGYVRAVRARPGDHVALGQPLVELEANDARASVARARAGLDQSSEARASAESALEASRAAARIAKSNFDRATTLLKDNAIPRQQYDEAEATWRSANALENMAQSRLRSVGSGIDEAKAALGEAQITLGYANIVAPFAGRVIERRVDPGALATPGMPLLVLADEESLRVEAAVEESYVDRITFGGQATVDIETRPGPLVGSVGEVVPMVDVASRAFLVKIDLPEDAGPLRPGTFARVSFPLGMKPRLVAPTTSLTMLGALDRVFVVEAGHAHLRMVTRGEAQGPWTEILSGLSAGEILVAAPPSGLRDGTPVEARP